MYTAALRSSTTRSLGANRGLAGGKHFSLRSRKNEKQKQQRQNKNQ